MDKINNQTIELFKKYKKGYTTPLKTSIMFYLYYTYLMNGYDKGLIYRQFKSKLNYSKDKIQVALDYLKKNKFIYEDFTFLYREKLTFENEKVVKSYKKRRYNIASKGIQSLHYLLFIYFHDIYVMFHRIEKKQIFFSEYLLPEDIDFKCEFSRREIYKYTLKLTHFIKTIGYRNFNDKYFIRCNSEFYSKYFNKYLKIFEIAEQKKIERDKKFAKECKIKKDNEVKDELFKVNLNKYRKAFNTFTKTKIMVILGIYYDDYILFKDIRKKFLRHKKNIIQDALYKLIKNNYVIRRKKGEFYEYRLSILGNDGIIFWNYNYKELDIDKLDDYCLNINFKVLYDKFSYEFDEISKQKHYETTPQFNKLRAIRTSMKQSIGKARKFLEVLYDIEKIKLGYKNREYFLEKYKVYFKDYIKQIPDFDVSDIYSLSDLNDIAFDVKQGEFVLPKDYKLNPEIYKDDDDDDDYEDKDFGTEESELENEWND